MCVNKKRDNQARESHEEEIDSLIARPVLGKHKNQRFAKQYIFFGGKPG